MYGLTFTITATSRDHGRSIADAAPQRVQKY
jgi:hypothetical protein